MGVPRDKENDDIEAKAPRLYDATIVQEPNKGRTSKFTTQQLFEQIRAEMQKNMAELIATRVELSATRGELKATRAELSATEQATITREVSLFLRSLFERTCIDISQLLAPSNAGPSTSATTMVPGSVSTIPTKTTVSHSTDIAPSGVDKAVTEPPSCEDVVDIP
nr:uncharacterized protein LOC104111132 [Nicotiana tomentosiformis]